MKKFSKVKNNLVKYFVESLIVAFGVFLGFYATESKNENKLRRDKEKTIKNIIQELESNRHKLFKTVEYHELISKNFDTLLKTIPKETYGDSFLTNKNFNSLMKIEDWVGAQFTEFETTAFEVAKTSETLQNMNIELLQEISSIYNKLEGLSDFENSINQRMVQLNYDTKTIDIIITISLITGDNLSMEKTLHNHLKETIAKIKALHSNR